MMEYIIRTLLLLDGVLLVKQGLLYIRTPGMALLKEEGLPQKGPGMDIVVSFLGISYFSIGMFNLLASLKFGFEESCYILMFSGFFFHIGMATVRDYHSMKIYPIIGLPKILEGIIRKNNKIQLTIGLTCFTTGMLGFICK